MSIEGSSHNRLMDIDLQTPLLGGLSPRTFMRRHWQKKPLLVRQAIPGGLDLIDRKTLFELAASDEVESRVVQRRDDRWLLRQGPTPRRSLPALSTPHWTLLVQGLDLHWPAARSLLDRFRFAPDARLDDLMLSFATDGGGVGPHVDSYDVFLLQSQGRRRWRIGRPGDASLVPDAPLRLLAAFEPEEEVLLEAGDMLYLPPGWGHDGVAVGQCTTCSIGYRAPGRDVLAREVLQRVLDASEDEDPGPLYRDPGQPASAQPGRVPEGLKQFAKRAIERLASDSSALACALGEVLSEPKRGVYFEGPGTPGAFPIGEGLRLADRSRMLYDDRHVFINGESFRAGGRDATLMRRMADRRVLTAREAGALSRGARDLIQEWIGAGWLLVMEKSES